MKFNLFVAAAFAGSAVAFPGMGSLMAELGKRQAPAPVQMIGDLATTGPTTPIGQQVSDCLNGAISCENPGPKVTISADPNGYGQELTRHVCRHMWPLED